MSQERKKIEFRIYKGDDPENKLKAELDRILSQKIDSKSRLVAMVAETSQRIIAPHLKIGPASPGLAEGPRNTR